MFYPLHNNNMFNTSPLRYVGGKTRACKIIHDVAIAHFENISETTKLISPFFGGGSFEFFMQNKYGMHIVANDKFQPLYNFWNQVKINKTRLVAELQEINNVTKEMFLQFRQEIMNLENDNLKQATYYFVINRCSFSGATLSGGFSKESSEKRFTKSSISRIEQMDLTNVDFYNFDFEQFINQQTIDENTIMFLDPPYYVESKLYGMNGDLHEGFEHEKLCELLKTKSNWLLTYNDCEFIRNLYRGYVILNVDWKYGMNKTKESSEIIILYKKHNQAV